MSSKRTIVLMAVLLVLLGVYMIRPGWEPRLTSAAPAPALPGTNNVSGLKLIQVPDSGWFAEFDYFYTGQPVGALLFVATSSEPAEAADPTRAKPGFRFGDYRPARPGQHHERMRLLRPDVVPSLQTHQVVAQMLAGRNEIIASQLVEQDISWPDQNTWAQQQAYAGNDDNTPFQGSVPDSDPLFEDMLRRTPTCSNAELEARRACPDFNERWLEETRIQGRFMANSFDWLDRRFEHLCSGAERLTSGIWKLELYPSALHDILRARNQWADDYKAIRNWESLQPDSRAARFVEAIYWDAYAWQARGEGYASTVSEESWQLFHERLKKSEALLAALIVADVACPAPYEYMIYALSDLGASEKELRTIYSKATRRFPEYHGIYFAMARHYEPRWGGSLVRYDAFADEAATATKAFEGMGMYARIYWLVDDRNATPFRAGTSPVPIWSKLKRGYEDLLRTYPSSLHNLRKFADVACRSNDQDLYRELRTRTASYEDSKRFFRLPPPLDSFEACDRRHHWAPLASAAPAAK